MYKYIFSVCVLLFCSSAFANTFYYEEPNYSYYPVNSESSYFYKYQNPFNKNLFSDIDDLEKYTFNKAYKNEAIFSRLQRLEETAFGAIQNGDPEIRYQNVKSAILSRPKQNYKTSLLKDLGNYFSGQMTGYTPPMNNYFNNYPHQIGPTYGRNYSSESFYPGGRARHNYSYGTGSSSSVRILY